MALRGVPLKYVIDAARELGHPVLSFDAELKNAAQEMGLSTSVSWAISFSGQCNCPGFAYLGESQ